MAQHDTAARADRYKVTHGHNIDDEEDDNNFVNVNLDDNGDIPQADLNNNDEDSSNEEGDKGGKVVFKKTKRHGFMLPLHPQQIGAWVAASILVISYFMVVIPSNYFIHVAWVVIFSLIYLGLVIALFYF